MTVKVIFQASPPQEREACLARSLTNNEMISLQRLLWSDELRGLLAEGERYQFPAVSRTSVRWYPRDEAANQEIIAVIEAFAADLPELAHEPHPERLCYTGGVLSQ